jgi:hypothetical protein
MMPKETCAGREGLRPLRFIGPTYQKVSRPGRGGGFLLDARGWNARKIRKAAWDSGGANFAG